MARMRPSGGYRKLRTFQMATTIYDATYWFCERFLDSRSRLVDQMVQAARSGRQNIAEGNRAAATTSQTELRLINVARASLEELLLDYEDFLRHRHFAKWDPEGPEVTEVRAVARLLGERPEEESSDAKRWALYAPWLDHEDPAIRANALICLIHQTNYMLDRQIAALEEAFVKEGGYSEQLAAARLAARNKKAGAHGLADEIPSCPKCRSTMVLRTAKQGANAGQQFWGCSSYSECKGVLPI